VAERPTVIDLGFCSDALTMSVFDTAEQWPDEYKACGAPHQSPVNLSRSFSLPCDRLCELIIDEVAVPSATVTADSASGAIILNFGDVKPTVRFNGEGYTAKQAYFFHPAQHTIEDVRAEAEFIVLFENPKGLYVALSVPVRTAPGDTPSTEFFSAFVPYPSEPDMPTEVVLGNSWEIQNIIPESKGFYTYTGSWVLPECFPDVRWCVFNSAVTIDPSDFAKMSSKGQGGTRPLQPVGDREVFFNEGEDIDNAYQKRDGKVYMRCRRIPVEGEGPPVDPLKKEDLQGANASALSAEQATQISNLSTSASDLSNSIGGIWGVLFIVFALALTYLMFVSKYQREYSLPSFNLLMKIPDFLHHIHVWLWNHTIGFFFPRYSFHSTPAPA